MDEMTPRERRLAKESGQSYDREPITLFHPDIAVRLAGMTIPESSRTAENIAKREITMYERFGVDDVKVNLMSLQLSSKHHFRTVKDLPNVYELDPGFFAFKNDRRMQVNYDAVGRLYDAIGQEENILYGIGGPLTFAGGIVTHAALLRGTRKYKEEVHHLLRLVTDVTKDMIDQFEPYEFMDYVLYDPVASGALISPKQYVEFAQPYTKELVDYIHEKGHQVTLHICGDTSKNLQNIADTGIDTFSADQLVDMAYAKETIGNQVKLMGNVDPSSQFLQGTPTSMAEAVKEVYQKAGDSPKGFVICSGCGVPYDTPIENIEAYMQTAKAIAKQH